MTTNNYPVCQVCSKSFKIITSSHLKSHGHTFETYRALFPNAALVDESHKERLRTRNTARKGTKASQETKDKMAASHTGKTHSQATKDAIGAKHKGKTRSKAEIDKWRITYYESIEENGGKGFAVGPRSQEFKDKMSAIAQARTLDKYMPKVEAMLKVRRGSTATPEQRKRYSEGRIKYMVANTDKLRGKFFDTVPEREFAAELEKRSVQFKKQYHMAKPHLLFDFLIEDKILVEIDGPYHYKPSFHNSQEAFERRVEYDAMKNYEAIKKGFQIYRIQVGQHIPNDWLEILKAQGFKLFDQ
jgi:very-short-patch-repair endonuclease